MSTGTPRPMIGAVVLTMNDRPDEFPAAMDSLLSQENIDLDVVVVGNGCDPAQVPDGVRTVELPTNVGIPEGRNVGAANVKGDLIFFFDNDAVLPSRDILARLAAEFARDPRRAYVQPRIADPQTGVTMRRWVPRLRTSDPDRGGIVTVMAEGVVMIRRDAFEAVGGWPGHFFLFHEGIDLAWRLWNHGCTGHYAPEIIVYHPATQPTRHELFYRLNARNRVWLARRNLPAALIPFNLAVWTLLTLWRTRRLSALRVSLAGLIEGIRGGHGARSPMSWSTVVRLTRAGRPPVC
ncbi:glycosyltransferase family 2 protein [Actinoallomurus spadix]|uniref:Glycosyltransferase n=1 Tax=Actinoallomurus spadix TaxID=79912 RepID=A0ABN0XLM1_9ACTN|nr:glycosyltransferase family 2 protein [Actinoallomurus spadix]MCO5985124.1 glycosyltransferase family 2 protein [Actinoallomurus spadix]